MWVCIYFKCQHMNIFPIAMSYEQFSYLERSKRLIGGSNSGSNLFVPAWIQQRNFLISVGLYPATQENYLEFNHISFKLDDAVTNVNV